MIKRIPEHRAMTFDAASALYSMVASSRSSFVAQGHTFDGRTRAYKAASAAVGGTALGVAAFRVTEHQSHYLVISDVDANMKVTIGEVWSSDRHRAAVEVSLASLVHLLDNITDEEFETIVNREHRVSSKY